MADTQSETPSASEPAAAQERETASSAFRHILFGVLIFGVVTGFYVWHARSSHAARMFVKEARELASKADVPSLRAAHDKLAEALDVQSSNEAAVAMMAEVSALLWVDHGVDEMKESAQEYVGHAKDDDIERAERYGAEGLVLVAEGRHDEAISLIKDVMARGAVSAQMFWALGLAQRAKGDAKEGRENLRRAHEAAVMVPQYATTLGDVCDDDGDDRNSSVFWDQAYKNNPSYVPAAARNLLVRLRRGEGIAAVRPDLDKLDALPAEAAGRVDRAAIEHARAEILFREGKFDRALEAANKAIELAGESSRRIALRGRLQLAMGKTDAGLADLAAAHAKQPMADRFFYELARAYSDNGKHAESLKLLEGMRDKRAEEAGFHVAVGDALRAKGDADAAAKSYDKALELEENNAGAMLGQGMLAWKKKKYDDATEWFEKAVGARTRFPEVYEAIGLMWIEQGAAPNANQQLEHAEKLFKQTGTDAHRMSRFYTSVIGALKSRSPSLVQGWVNREKAFREGT
jgi:tetratricopeptide (TPR) repeat protein